MFHFSHYFYFIFGEIQYKTNWLAGANEIIHQLNFMHLNNFTN